MDNRKYILEGAGINSTYMNWLKEKSGVEEKQDEFEATKESEYLSANNAEGDDWCEFGDYSDMDVEEDYDSDNVPAPVVWRICKESMKYNTEANRMIVCPRHGSTAITNKLLEGVSPDYFEFSDAYKGEIEWYNNMTLMNAMPSTQNIVEYNLLRECLIQVVAQIIEEGNPSLPHYIAIPYFLAVDENKNPVMWGETIDFIVGVLEEQVNIERINEDTLTQIDVTFYENW